MMMFCMGRATAKGEAAVVLEVSTLAPRALVEGKPDSVVLTDRGTVGEHAKM